MSRSGAIENAIDDINQGINDFNDATGSVTVKLGDFIFGHMEVPKSINFGGEQSLYVHQYVGGKRSIDAMGRLDSEISWNGHFFGSAALNRARYLDNLRVDGQKLTFTYSKFIYSVVIRSFTADLEKTFQIPYRITLTVIEDQSLPVTFAIPLSYGDAIIQDYQKALSLVDFVRDSTLSAAMNALGEEIIKISNFSSSTKQERIDVFDSATETQTVNKSIINETQKKIF